MTLATVLGDRRASGILLHPSSLPGPYAHGDLGEAAHAFVDFLAAAGQRCWQMLPVNPTGPGNSPYSGVSAFAGNPLFISLDGLCEAGLLKQGELGPPMSSGPVDFERAYAHRLPLLRRAFDRFQRAPKRHAESLARFRKSARYWLSDYCLFMALRRRYQGASWDRWDTPLRRREPRALRSALRELREDVAYYEFEQLMFDSQFRALRQKARASDVHLIGDIPIFVAYDSADVWAHPRCFLLDARLKPRFVSGVPPDYFSEEGQLWGTPLYAWSALKRDAYSFWVERLRTLFSRFDLVRLDHFIGFVRYFQIPAGATTAKLGRWRKGPGADLFRVAARKLGELPLIAEDLGDVSDEVLALRDHLGLPGMRVLQFAFGSGADNPFLPHNYVRSCVAYTGTHDNGTLLGWLKHGATPKEREHMLAYLGARADASEAELCDRLMRSVLGSVAQLSILPLQDVLGLDDRARMNVPGRPEGNWAYRVSARALSAKRAASLRKLTETYGR